MYDVDYAQLLQEGVTSANTSWPTRSCDAWTFDLTTSGNYATIVSDVSGHPRASGGPCVPCDGDACADFVRV